MKSKVPPFQCRCGQEFNDKKTFSIHIQECPTAISFMGKEKMK